MIGDASPISDHQLMVLARAFALNSFHGAALSPHESELIATLAERFLIMGSATAISRLEQGLLLDVLGALEAAFDDAAPRAAQLVQRVSA